MKDNNIKIVISGVEGVNKGAELMLYAILAQIEERFPNAIIFLPISQFPNGLGTIKTSLTLKQSPNKFVRFLGKNHITGLLNRLGLRFKYLNNLIPIKGACYYLDASGLYFSDQMISSERIAKDLHVLLQGYKKQGTKIIYLPQAFGPFEKKASKIAIDAALRYSDFLTVRDSTSMKYLLGLNTYSTNIKQYPDFTSIVSGIIPPKYNHLTGRVCIIPNSQVIRKGIMLKEDYLNLITHMVTAIYNAGYEAFFLEHANDSILIEECAQTTKYDIPIVSGLDALSVKGLVGQSYLCISSRFHGVASAFSNNVPCLTTSWNHKYQELLELYGMEKALLSSSAAECITKVKYFLDKKVNTNIREELQIKNHMVQEKVKEMWKEIWDI